MQFWQRNLSKTDNLCFGIKYDNHRNVNIKINSLNHIKMANVNIRPLGTRIVVEVAAAEVKTASGLIIPDSAKEKPQRGTVVAVGNGVKDEAMELKVGDTILYGKYAGTEIQIDGKDYLMMKQSDVFAIL